MTAVESQSTPSSFHDTHAESPTSRFTAVNGREPLSGPASSNATNGHNNPRKSSEDRPQAQPRISPPGQEKLTITTTTLQKEDWANPINREKSSNQTGPQFGQPLSYSGAESSHKRKRSGSIDRQASQTVNTHSYHNHAPPASKPEHESRLGRISPDTPYPDAAREASMRTSLQSAPRDPYATPQTDYAQYNEEGRETGSASWYSDQSPEARNTADAQHSALTQNMSPDDQLREALQRENQGTDSRGVYAGTSPGGDHDRGANDRYQGSYGLQADHKKRKRNFSNRTKTGCMTCRRRKKKCDESRPECNNCIRGGFVCNGYPSRGQWPKTEQKQAPIPLQSKDGYDTNSSQYPQPSPYQHSQPGQSKREPLPGYRGQQLRVDPPQPPSRPLGIEDERPSASTIPSASVSSPENRLSALSYSHAATFPTPVSANPGSYADRLSHNEYKRMPPLHDPSRQEHDTGTPQSAQSTVPHISILHPSHSNSPHPHTPQSSAVQDVARLVLSLPASASRQHTQKEDMLLGKHHFPFDRELVLERERCLAALWRFNNSTNPNNGISPENRVGLFRDILQPRDHINLSPTLATPNSPAGYVGNNVVVSAPFTCEYGYNIHIGQDVVIGKNCTIMDTCEVKIGDRCVIGPNVNIITTMLPIDPMKRLGSRGPNFGKPIIIEDDCWIGAGVTILPGRVIKKGSTVAAAAVVTRDVPPFTVVGGNPARVMRGIHG